MSCSTAPVQTRPLRQTPALRRVLAAAALAAGCLQGPLAQPQGPLPTRNPGAQAPDKPRSAVTVVRTISTRSHMQCPLPGKNSRLLSIDSPREWADTIEHQDEVTALGRKVRWAKERVLVYALESRPHAGVRLDSPARAIRLSNGVLYWPVRQVLPDAKADKATVLTRPCVMTTIDRAYWQRIKVVPAQP